MNIKKIAVLFTAAIIALSSCYLFDSKEKEEVNPLIGSWKIDSLSVGRDSSAIGYLLLAMAMNKQPVELTFTKDSFYYFSNADTTSSGYEYNEETKALVVKDSVTTSYQFTPVNDSLISLTSADSSTLFLRKSSNDTRK